MSVNYIEHDPERHKELLWRFAVRDRGGDCVVTDEPPPSEMERYPNGGTLLSVYLVSHECEAANEADVCLELWAFTEDERDWWLSWKLIVPLYGNWPFAIDWCPFCGTNLGSFHGGPT